MARVVSDNADPEGSPLHPFHHTRRIRTAETEQHFEGSVQNFVFVMLYAIDRPQ